MPVEKTSDRRQCGGGRKCEELPSNLQFPLTRTREHGSWVPPVGQSRPFRSPMLFECNQSRVIEIGASHVQFHKPTRLRLLDRLPKEKCHAAESVVPGIGAAVLVNNRFLIGKRDHTGYRPTIFGGNRNLYVVPEAIAQILKPRNRLRRQMMAPLGQDQKAIELLSQPVRSAFRISSLSRMARRIFLCTQLLWKPEKARWSRPTGGIDPRNGSSCGQHIAPGTR